MMKKRLFLSGSELSVVQKLNDMGYYTITSRSNPLLDAPVSSHADCLMFSADYNTYIIEKSNYNSIVNFFTKGGESLKLIKAEEDIYSPYPFDVRLNAKCFGKNIICNTSVVSNTIKKFAEINGYNLLHCNQGYVACSTVKLSDNAAITDDESVYNVLQSIGIDCIKVSKGSVRLKGFDYGFIGGCCGMIESNLIAFAGTLETHTDSNLIKSFLIKNSIEYINLADGELTDIGGIIPLYKI